MSAIVEFLEARIAEDEAYAKESAGHSPWPDLSDMIQRTQSTALALHMRQFSADRIKAECLAKRGELAEIAHLRNRGPMKQDLEWCIDRMLRYMLYPYSDHPDFDASWNA